MLIRPVGTLPKVMAPSMSMTSDVGEDPTKLAIEWVISYPNHGPDWNLYRSIPYKYSPYPQIVYTPNNNGAHEFCSKSLVCWITFRMRGSGAGWKRILWSYSIPKEVPLLWIDSHSQIPSIEKRWAPYKRPLLVVKWSYSRLYKWPCK